MAQPRTILDRTAVPAKTAHRFGLKSVTAVKQEANGHWMFGSEWQESCGANIKVAPDNCDLALTDEERTKESFALNDGVGTTDFTLYGFHRCSAVGTAISERSTYAMEELNLGEWQQVERLFIEKVIAEGTAGTSSTDAAKALGKLLQGWHLPVEPTVHVTPNVAIALGSQIQNKVNHLEIRTGEHVANGFGYVGAQTALGADYLAATEGIIALTGPAFATIGTALQGEQMDPATNTYLALAERPFSVGYSCDALYVKITGL